MPIWRHRLGDGGVHGQKLRCTWIIIPRPQVVQPGLAISVLTCKLERVGYRTGGADGASVRIELVRLLHRPSGIGERASRSDVVVVVPQRRRPVNLLEHLATGPINIVRRRGRGLLLEEEWWSTSEIPRVRRGHTGRRLPHAQACSIVGTASYCGRASA